MLSVKHIILALQLLIVVQAIPIDTNQIAEANEDLGIRALGKTTAPVAAKPPVAAAKPPTAAASPATKPPPTAAKPPTAVSPATPPPAKGASCPVKKPAAKTTAKSSRELLRRVEFTLDRLFKRDGEEFIGFHGTNSETATFWASQGGKITKPPAPSGDLDFTGNTNNAGTSGANEDLGPGLYITDDLTFAQGFANGNAAKQNLGRAADKKVTPKVCAIFAASELNWRGRTPKVFIPNSLIGDSSTFLKQRGEYLEGVGAAETASSTNNNVVLFSVVDPRRKFSLGVSPSQILLPSPLTSNFIAKCADVNGPFAAGAATQTATTAYFSKERRLQWQIIGENQPLATSIKDGGCIFQ